MSPLLVVAAVVAGDFDYVLTELQHREGAAALADGFTSAEDVVGVEVGGKDRSWFLVLGRLGAESEGAAGFVDRVCQHDARPKAAPAGWPCYFLPCSRRR